MIGIFDWGRRGFPRVTVEKVAPQRLAARDQAVVAVRRREGRQEGECLAAAVTDAAANPNPIVVFIVRLLATAAVTNDGVLGADWATAQDDFAGLGPIGFEVVLRGRKWDKQNRSKGGSGWAPTFPRDLCPARGPSLLTQSHLEQSNAALPPSEYA